MKIRFLYLLIASGMSTGVQGGDLLDAYRMAVANDPSYLSSVFERQVTAQDPTIARAALKPSINLTGDGSRIREDVDSRNQVTRGSDNYNSTGVALSLNQTLFSRQARIAIDQAELDNQRAGIDLESARQEVIIRVATSYFSVLGAIDNLDLATSEKIAIQRQLELASERLNVGIGTQTDLYDAEARFQLAEANEIEARNLIEDARESLIAIVGADPGPLRPLREDAPLQVPAPESAEDWVSIAIANNPALQSASLDFAIAQQEIEFQKSTRSPNIALNAAQGYRDNSGGINGSSDRTNTSVGLELRMPLYLGGAVAARVQKAALGANAQEQVVEFTRRQISRNVRDVYNDVVSGIGRVEALRLAVIAGQSAVEARQEGFSAGLITNLDVLDAQRDLFQARRDYRRARYDFILSVLTLEEVAGQLSEEDVVRINSWLE